MTKKKQYFCVMSEFYTNDGTSKFIIKSRVCEEKPKNQEKIFYRMIAYRVWFETLEAAEDFIEDKTTQWNAATISARHLNKLKEKMAQED